jgi:predicted ABC-type transport system involved in lysophospholipase L1 biosynthesis ATPase subunit
MERRTHELLAQLAVSIPSARAEAGGLSGGQRQQVAVARSLLREPARRPAARPRTVGPRDRAEPQRLDHVKRDSERQAPLALLKQTEATGRYADLAACAMSAPAGLKDLFQRLAAAA